MCIEIASKIRTSSFNPSIIVGIARGGWIPARILSDLLENSYTAHMKIEFYRGINEREKTPIITQPVTASVRGESVLIVDDVADTGLSLIVARESIKWGGAKEIRIATLYYKPKRSRVKPDYYARETDAWVVFPWEVKETIRKIAVMLKNKGLSRDQIKRELYNIGLKKKHVDLFLPKDL